MDKYKVLKKRIENPLIESLYEDLGLIDNIEQMKKPFRQYKNKCAERKEMCIECYPEFCYKDCNNCDISINDEKLTVVKESKIQGKGLFAGEKLTIDQYIIEYIGNEIVGKAPKISTSKYLMQLAKHYIDARQAGNNARYINHSDTPNSKFSKRMIRGVERCGVFSMKEIKFDEEITCDYGCKIKQS